MIKKHLDEAKAKWSTLDDDDKLAVAGGIVVGAFVLILFLFLIVALIRELFVPALVVLAVYAFGARKWGWPVPKKVKQFFVK